MSKKAERTFVVRGFNVQQENFSSPVGVIEDKSTFKELVVNTQAEAIVAMLTDADISTMAANSLLNANEAHGSLNLVGESEFINANDSKNVLQVIDLKITLNLTDKLDVRATKSTIREVVKRWAEKSRNKGRRGFRANAIKTPLFEYAFDETYAKIQVILSNAIIYADNSADITPNSYMDMVDDLALLRKELNRQLGWKFTALNFNHSSFGKGEVL